MSKYKITNKKIMDFYDANESLDFQTMNLIFIDILQQIKSGLNSTINSTINSQILSEISDIRENINNINNSFYMKYSLCEAAWYGRLDDVKRALEEGIRTEKI